MIPADQPIQSWHDHTRWRTARTTKKRCVGRPNFSCSGRVCAGRRCTVRRTFSMRHNIIALLVGISALAVGSAALAQEAPDTSPGAEQTLQLISDSGGPTTAPAGSE